MAASPGLQELLAGARRVLVFTGAGISTASGIPDFRGPQGIWRQRQPVYFDEFMSSEAKRIEYWEYKAEGHALFRAARPNATHHAVARLEELGRLEAVVTQNIDGLHQKAGTSPGRLHEIHGTNRFVECVSCKERSEPGPHVKRFGETGRAPVCSCGGFLKFATISFGQALEPHVIEASVGAARNADLVVAMGSTLAVHPAATIPLVAVERGVPYVVINRGGTDHDGIATLRLEGDVAALFPPAVAALEEG